MPLLPQLLERHPRLVLEMVFADSMLDLVAPDYLAIRGRPELPIPHPRR